MSVSEIPSKLYSLRTFQFVMVGLEDLPPGEAERLAQDVCEVFESHEGEVSSISSFLIIGYFGLLWSKNSPSAREAVVAGLLRKNATLIRIAHGQCTSLAGILGSKQRFSYEGLIPGLQEIREKLSQTAFGTAFEAPEKQ